MSYSALPTRTRFESRTESRRNSFITRVEDLLGAPLTQRQLEQAHEAYLEGESAVEFALSAKAATEEGGRS